MNSDLGVEHDVTKMSSNASLRSYDNTSKSGNARKPSNGMKSHKKPYVAPLPIKSIQDQRKKLDGEEEKDLIIEKAAKIFLENTRHELRRIKQSSDMEEAAEAQEDGQEPDASSR